MSNFFCWSCNAMVTVNADQNCSTCGSDFIEATDQPPIDVPQPVPDQPVIGAARANGGLDRTQSRSRTRPVGRAEPRLGGPRLAAASNITRASHSRHNNQFTLRSTDGTDAAQVMHMDHNDPFMLMQAIMGNAFNGSGFRVMLGDQMYGEPGDYIGSERAFDRLITTLMNEMERSSGPPAAPPETISNLPEAQITEEQVRQSIQCSICFENFTLRERVKLLPCAHMYHKECIEKWLNMHGTCPVCRKTLDGHDTSFSEHPDEASGGGGGAAAASSSRASRSNAGHASSSRSHAGASSSSSSRHGAAGGGSRGGGGSHPGGRRHRSNSDSMAEYQQEDPNGMFGEHFERGAVIDLSSSPEQFEDASDHVIGHSPPDLFDHEDSNASFSSSTAAERSSPARLHSSDESSPVRRPAQLDSPYGIDSAYSPISPPGDASNAGPLATEATLNDSVIIVGESPGRLPMVIRQPATSSAARSLEPNRLSQTTLDPFRTSNGTSSFSQPGAGRRFAGSNSNSSSSSRVENNLMDWNDSPNPLASTSVSSSTSAAAAADIPRYGSGSKWGGHNINNNNKTGRERGESKEEELGFHRGLRSDDDDVQMTGITSSGGANSSGPKRAVMAAHRRVGAESHPTGSALGTHTMTSSSTASTSTGTSSRPPIGNGTASQWSSISSRTAANASSAVAAPSSQATNSGARGFIN